jgi:hypothetical protein
VRLVTARYLAELGETSGLIGSSIIANALR